MSTTDIQQHRVGGMSCGHCVAAVTEEVSRVAGAEEVDVDLAAGTVTVRGQADPDAVRQAIEEAGYEVVG